MRISCTTYGCHVEFTYALKRLRNYVIKSMRSGEEKSPEQLWFYALGDFWESYMMQFEEETGADLETLKRQIKTYLPDCTIDAEGKFKMANYHYMIGNQVNKTEIQPVTSKIADTLFFHGRPISNISKLIPFDEAIPAFKIAVKEEILNAKKVFFMTEIAASAVKAVAEAILAPIGIEYCIRKKTRIIKLSVPLPGTDTAILACIRPGEEYEVISAVLAIFKENAPIPDHYSDSITIYRVP